VSTQLETRCKQEGVTVYATMDKNERLIVRFGMFPRKKMEDAEKVLLAEEMQATGKAVEPRVRCDIGRWLAVGVMQAANAGAEKMIA
jgi:hypothetical protein